MGLPLPSVLRNKSFSRLKAILMSLSAVPRAVKQGRQIVTEMVTTGPSDECFPQYVPRVVRKPKYRSNPVKVDQCIVVNATVKPD